MLAQDTSWLAFGTMDLQNHQRAGLVDEPQTALLEPGMTNRHFHDLTVWSAGLPVNVADGGWRRDLTAFIQSDGNVPDATVGGSTLLGLADTDNLVGPANSRADQLSASPGQASRYATVSPKFGLLRNWARRAEANQLGDITLDNELAKMANVSTGGRNSTSVDFENRTESNIMPTLVEGSLFYNLSYYQPDNPNPAYPYALRVHFYPRVALWNPYNFTLKVPESAIFMHINGSKTVEVNMQTGRTQKFHMYLGPRQRCHRWRGPWQHVLQDERRDPQAG
ncbi:MAG: hypothetical protein QM755_03010 [Luteolibacter sp.]